MTISVSYETVKSLFNIGAETKVPVFNGFSRVPSIDPNFIFREDHVTILLTWYFKGESAGMRNLLLWGPHGSGKTELVRQFAARLGIPVFEDVGAADRVFSDYVGNFMPTENGLAMVDSMLVKSMRTPQAIYLINEIDLSSQDTATGFNNLLDKHVLESNITSEKIVAAKGWRICATGNTNMSGDTTGLYKATKTHNASLASRFFLYPCSYMTQETEKAVLAKYGIDPLTSEIFVRFAAATRTAFMDGRLRTVLTTRELVSWALQATALSATTVFKDPKHAALEMSFLSKAIPKDKAALIQAYYDITSEKYVGIELNRPM